MNSGLKNIAIDNELQYEEQTLIEKLVSLIRFSFNENPVESLEQKIRHFYDLYF